MRVYFSLLLGLLLLLPQSTFAYSLGGSYVTLDGSVVDYSDHEGEILLVEAFLPDCPHCHDQHPELEQLWNTYNTSFDMISLSLTSTNQISEVQSYVDSYPSNWVIGIDKDDYFQNTFNIPATPSILFFDSAGEFASCDVGTMSFDSLESKLEQLMNDPQGYKAENAGDGACEKIPFIQRFVNSIFFPILIAVVLYGIIIVIRKYKT